MLERFITALAPAPVTIIMHAFFLTCLMGICGAPVPAPVSSHEPPPLQTETAATESAERRVQPIAIAAPEPPTDPTTAPADEPAPGNAPGKLTRDAIAAVVKRERGAIKHCYELALIDDLGFAGTVEVGWKIQLDGHVSSAKIVDATRHNDVVESCLVAAIVRWEFPAASEPTAVGAFPFVFDAALLAVRAVHATRAP